MAARAARSASVIKKPASPFPSGNDPAALDQIRGWNWGAFFVPFIWSSAHKLWLPTILSSVLPAFIYVMPHLPYNGETLSILDGKQYISLLFYAALFVNIAVHIYVGVKGNELAWKTYRFESVEQFRLSQREWAKTGGIILIAMCFVFIILMPGFLKARDRGRYTAAKEMLVNVQTAVEVTAHGKLGTTAGAGFYSNSAWGKNNICKLILKNNTCTDAGTGKTALETHISQSVSNFSLTIKSVSGSPDATYIIKGEALDKLHCKICVTPNGVFPDRYDYDMCAAGTCP